MGLGTLLLALLAGVFSTLSPCVIPLLPVVLGSAVADKGNGIVALAAGLAISFVAIGLFFLTIGFTLGIDGEILRLPAALVLILVGGTLLVPALQNRFALAAGPVADWGERRFGGSGGLSGSKGQFALGLLLGVVWIPCVGPTLGAATLLASRGENLLGAAAVMTLFGIGAALPLIAIGRLSRTALARWRGRLAGFGAAGRKVLGGALVAIGLLVATGLDRQLETYLVGIAPDWLNELTTRF